MIKNLIGECTNVTAVGIDQSIMVGEARKSKILIIAKEKKQRWFDWIKTIGQQKHP